jgi:starvation-inducible DNA-binding protein
LAFPANRERNDIMTRKTAPESTTRKRNGAHPGTRANDRSTRQEHTRLLNPAPRDHATPIAHQRGPITQRYGSVVRMPIGLEADVCRKISNALNQLLADTMTLRDLYKKHHWQVSGHTFYQLHLLFDKHYEEQSELVDLIAERIQLLGGISIAMAGDVAETTKIPRPPRDREEVPVQISRLLEAHELICREARETADLSDEEGDWGTNDLLASDVLPTNEMQAWFVSEHVVDTPLVHAEGEEHES